jgi:hypothetical protein
MTARERTYKLSGVIDKGVESRLRDVHVACPGRIVRYDADKQQADVQPLVQVVYLNEAGDRQVESLPVVPNVPVIFPGAGGFRITFPVTAGDEDGDTCLLIFSESSLDRWLDQGGGPLDPQDDRRFHLSDGVAVLGLRDYAHALASAPVDRMTLGKDDGPAIHIDGDGIRIGDNDAPNLDTAALGGAVASALASIAAKLSSHTHPVSGSVAGVSVNAAPTIGTVQSSIVKVAK